MFVCYLQGTQLTCLVCNVAALLNFVARELIHNMMSTLLKISHYLYGPNPYLLHLNYMIIWQLLLWKALLVNLVSRYTWLAINITSVESLWVLIICNFSQRNKILAQSLWMKMYVLNEWNHHITLKYPNTRKIILMQTK